MTSYKQQLDNIKAVENMLSNTADPSFCLIKLKRMVLMMATDLKEYIYTAQEEDEDDFVVPDDEVIEVEDDSESETEVCSDEESWEPPTDDVVLL